MGTQLDFVDQINGWLLVRKGVAYGSNPVDIYRTQDGGKTWEEVSAANAASGIPVGGIKTGMTFQNNGRGWVTGQQPTGAAIYYFSEDGGHGWDTKTIPVPKEYPSHYTTTYPPIFFNANDG